MNGKKLIWLMTLCLVIAIIGVVSLFPSKEMENIETAPAAVESGSVGIDADGIVTIHFQGQEFITTVEEIEEQGGKYTIMDENENPLMTAIIDPSNLDRLRFEPFSH